MCCIQHNEQVDWIFMLCDHMLKAKRLMDFKPPYVVLVSKFIEYFGVDVEDELEESTRLLNQTSYQNLHKMGFTKVGNMWTIDGIAVRGTHDHEADSSGENQGENVDTNSLDDLLLEDVMEVHEVIALEHVGTMLTLMKM